MTAGALTLCSASITAFKASAAGINAVATPTAAAFTRMAVAVAPFTAAIIALAGPMMATSASMVVFAGDQVAALAENRSVRHGCANPLSAAFLAVCHSGQLHFRAFAAQDVVGVQAGNAARTDDSKSKHTETLPS